MSQIRETLKLMSYKRDKDGYAWRCIKRTCASFKKYSIIKMVSFLMGLALL